VMKSCSSPPASRSVAKVSAPWRRSSLIRPATRYRSSVSSPGPSESCLRRTSSREASGSNPRANGWMPRALSRSSFCLLAASVSARRPLDSSSDGSPGSSLIAGGVLLVDEAQPLQREPRLMVLDGLRPRADGVGAPAPVHDGYVAPELLRHLHDHV